MERVILISAKARHGKDSTAEYLKKQFESNGKRVAIMHFAQYIKRILKDFYYPDWDMVSKDEEIRTKLQFLGTEKIKIELKNPLFHTKRIAEDIQIISNDYDVVLIPDWRFQDEGNYIKAVFPYITSTIRVNRLGFESDLTEEQKRHRSEVDLDNYHFDYTVYVQSGLQHLHDELDRMFKGKWY